MKKHLAVILLLVACKGRDREHLQSQRGIDIANQESSPSLADHEDNWDRPASSPAAMALDEGKMGAKERAPESPDAARADAAQNARAAGVLGSSEISSGFDDKTGFGPGGGGNGDGTIGTGRYGTIGKGSGTGSGYGVGGGRGGMRGRNAAAPSVSLGQADTSETAAVTRAWFPETFLFEPLIVTDQSGGATVPVKVPDRLTTWHVLALAHSRQGAQGGATTSFMGTLPAYVDLVVPKFLVIGDQIKLPIQMVNTTETGQTSALTLEVKNATLTGGGGTKTIPAQGGAVDYAMLTANKAGTIEVKATLGNTDAVVRTIEVKPAGRPETVDKTGTLAAPRTLTIAGPAGSDPETDRVRLTVYPGALSLLRSELGVSTYREGVADDAYALLLAGEASELLVKLGDKADPEALRTLGLLTGQRAIRDGRTLDVDRATLLTAAALTHPGNPVLSRLGERAAAFLAKNQRPDGSFSGGSGWTLQRVLVASAEATRAVAASHTTATERQRMMGVTARATGEFDRTIDQVTDGYTAAAILASGAASTASADKLRDRVKAAIKTDADGSKYLEVAEGVVRADGARPTTAEATALAVLALDGDPKAPLADLGGTLLGSYSPERGWGDGRANLACMQAVLVLFKDPVPPGVKITLAMDGKEITTGTIDRDALKDVLSLEAAAPGIAGEHEWKITAEPAVPGLGYALQLKGYVPWQKQTTQQGLEMTMTPAPVVAEVGKPVEVTVTAIAPSGNEVKIVQALPAGVQPDTASLDALVAASTITKHEEADGKLTLTIPALEPGATFTAKYKLIPTLAGKLRSAASTITTGQAKFSVPPSEWTVK